MAPSPEVIDLTGDDDDVGGMLASTSARFEGSSSRKRRKQARVADRKPPPPTQQPKTLGVATNRSLNVKKEAAEGEMKPAATMDVDEDEDGKDDDAYYDRDDSYEDDDDDEVQLVDPPATLELLPLGAAPISASSSDGGRGDAAAAIPGVAFAAAAAASAGEDVELVGIKNSTRLSHMRQHCTEHPFAVDPKLFCQDCYCYVCDVPASECEAWETDHCRATNTGPTAYVWRQRREQAKNPKPPAWNSPMVAGGLAVSGPSNRLLGDGPWEPTHAVANADYEGFAGLNVFDDDYADDDDDYGYGYGYGYDDDPQLVKCRHCGWFSRNKRSASSNPSCEDWCYACGRVGDPAALLKHQGKPYKPGPNSIQLGSKTFSFRLRAHDPRKMKEFKAKWTRFEGKADGWNYSEVNMEKELFDHRFGERPSLGRILGSAPVVGIDKIPVDGARKWVSTTTSRTPSAVETEAILLDDDAVRLLDSLYSVASRFGNNNASPFVEALKGNLAASWNTENRCGEISIEVYLHDVKTSTCPRLMNRFLGCWFGIFPFPLRDICGNLTPSNTVQSHLKILASAGESVSLPPNSIKYSSLAADPTELKTALESLEAQGEELSASRSLSGSSTSSTLLGGTCQSEVDFSSVLKRYYTETFAELIRRFERADETFLEAWCMQQLGLNSRHRQVMKVSRYQSSCEADVSQYHGSRHSEQVRTLWTILDPKDALLALSLCTSADALYQQVTTLEGLMQHLENRGHPEVTAIDGLTVELLPFQKQSVQWAKERESVAGGIQRFLWTKVPVVDDELVGDLYYCPLLGKFSKVQPQVARGGIIGEMMGLGKTVISLATILANPAPLLPEPGSRSDSIPPSPDTSVAFRDPLLFELHSTTTPKRGSIISRGTLVVCNVSLVGQWIDEAKSKLKDPGLVYSYHGHSRKRDPLVLAMNSIVVTTYETLASDATYHRTKSQEHDYCPPCEHVRWWRIICDESHVLRYANNSKSEAVMNLVADNKWLVSGTPVNTTLADLENQFRFLGIEDVAQLMRDVRESTCRQINDKGARSSNKRGRSSYDPYSQSSYAPIGHFTFLTRELIMRHAHEQTYTGTSTTLMSLPPKSERSISVSFSSEERTEYAMLEAEATSFYTSFRCENGHELQKHYLKLIQRLIPLRIACAGGHVPLYEEVDNENEVVEDSDDESEGGERRKKKSTRKLKCFTEFAYTSKLLALIGELERVQIEDPSAKSLVFSQFTSTLDWLKKELPGRGFQFRTLSGDMSMSQRKKALQDFQNDPPTTVFLLSMRAGAVGINLTQANRVFIMEPFLNPALEAQAIGRVHRLGQKRPVEIIRLIVADSIETRLQSVIAKRTGGKNPPGSSAADDGVESSRDGVNPDEDDDKKPAAVTTVDPSRQQSVATPLIGSISADKAIVAAEEFDCLYGFTNEAGDGSDAETDDGPNVC